MKLINMRAIFTLFALLLMYSWTFGQTTAFNYQGSFKDGVNPANGNYDFEFALFDAVSGGAPVGTMFPVYGLTVSNGSFSSLLDFGNQFPGAARFLEIRIRAAGGGPFTTLVPRQAIASAPYSIRSLSGGGAGGVSGSGTTGRVPLWNAGTTLANSVITQNANGEAVVSLGGTGGDIQFGRPNGETGMTMTGAAGTARADIRFDGSALRIMARPGTLTGPPANGLLVTMDGVVGTSGNLGVGTFAPDTRLTIDGGLFWTSSNWKASMNLRNGAAIAWDANPTGRRWGIAQGTTGLNFFRSFSSFGTTASPAEYAMVLTNEGHITQPLQNNGVVKAMAWIAGDLNSTVLQCYNSQAAGAAATTPPCGINATFEENGPGTGFLVDFGFDVSNRFISATVRPHESDISAVSSRVTPHLVGSSPQNPNRSRVIFYGEVGPNSHPQIGFFIFVF